MNRSIIALTMPLLVVGFTIGCVCTKEREQQDIHVTLAELSAPARATVERVTSGGRVDQVDKEVERGRTVYDVEATVGGRHLEFLIAESDGEVLGTEVPIAFAELPDAVQTAATKYFGRTSGLTVMKGVEYGETQYEIEGPKDGKNVEVTFDHNGKRGD